MNYYYVAVVVLNSWKCVLEHVYIGELGDIQAMFVPSQNWTRVLLFIHD